MHLLRWVVFSMTIILEFLLFFIHRTTDGLWFSAMMWCLLFLFIVLVSIFDRRSPGVGRAVLWGIAYGSLTTIAIVVFYVISLYVAISLGCLAPDAL